MQTGDFYLNEIWNKVLNKVSETGKIATEIFDLYFNGTKLIQLTNDKATVVCSSFISFSIMAEYLSMLETFLHEVIGHKVPIYLIEESEYTDEREISKDEGIIKENPFFKQSLDLSHTFDNFVTGKSNLQAHVAATTAAKNPGYMYNPLFIYGPSGIGKTHLLNAIGNRIVSNFPELKVGYITGSDFVDDVYYASKNKLYDEMKDSFKDLDLLLVDDIQFIADKPKSHEIFFTIFNYLVSNKKQICVTSDRSPDEIKGLETRLITRFNQGLTVNITAPEYETAVNILKYKINNNISISQQINDDVISYIATNFSQDVRSLEGALTRLLFYSVEFSDNKDHITLDLAMEAFKDQIANNKGGLTFYRIKNIVADYYNISREMLISKNKTKNIVNARHIAIYLCRKWLDEPYDKIGKEFGNRDHSTIMSACEKVEKSIKDDINYKQAVAELETKFN